MRRLPFYADRRTAEQLEDLASRLDAGLPPAAARPGETAVASLRRTLSLREWELAALEAGATAGRLPAVLRQLAAARQAAAAWQRQALGALAYPAFVLLLCAVVALIILSLGRAPRGWVWLSGGLLLAVIASAAWLARRLRDPLLDGDRYPVLGRVTRCAGEIPYLVALQVLYGAGVPLRTAHAAAAASSPMPWVRARLFLATSHLEAGEPLAAALDRHRALTTESQTLVRDGEATGQLEDALGRATRRRQEEYATTMRRGARLLGSAAYVYAVVSVAWIAVTFYTGALRGLR